MVRVCKKCGKTLKTFEGIYYETDTNNLVCENCYDRLRKEKKEKENEEKININNEEKKQKELGLKQDISESQLSLPEMQLRYQKEMSEDIKQLNNMVSNINLIITILFFLFLINLILTIILLM